MLYLTTPIFPLLLLAVGVAARFAPPQDDLDVLQPIVSRSQARRICAELCLAGLGGRPCGEDCVDLVPQALPMQFGNGSEAAYGPRTRHGACKVLCENDLGRPLCNCEKGENGLTPDYVQVCSLFCIKYDYRLYGCQKCSVYNETISLYSDFSVQMLRSSSRPRADYNSWCAQQCQEGNGGAACNCDILPMMMMKNPNNNE